MNSEIVKVDGYDAARAIATSQSLRTLEHEARGLGYGSIAHEYLAASNSWRYVFRRTTPRPVDPQPISERSGDGVIDI